MFLISSRPMLILDIASLEMGPDGGLELHSISGIADWIVRKTKSEL